MKRDVAIRVDAMLMHSRANMDAIASYMKNNFSDEEFAECIKHIGYAMSELIDISNKLHSASPDIVPDELK